MDKELLKKIKLKVAKKRLLTKAEFIESIQLHNIPIVFHVIHHNDLENIPKEQILDQLNSLNKDFRNQNIDNVLFDTYSHEKYLATDSKIQFTIAEMDPNGNSTDGITRKCTNREFFEKLCNPSSEVPLQQQPVKSTSSGGEDAWDTTKYLNVWICNLQGASGYAQYPKHHEQMSEDQIKTDGVVIDYKCFGSGATTGQSPSKGKVLTHEIGHWLGIFHLCGPGAEGHGCNSTDDCEDTPPQAGIQRGQPSGHPSDQQCPGCDPPIALNFMDEWDDEYSLMFTRDQVSTMQDYLENLRSSIFSRLPLH